MQNYSKTTRIVLFALLMLGLAIGMKAFLSTQSSSTKYQGLAQCLTNKGAKFYGAFWCSHCGEQKRLFGEAAKSLPYVECSNPDHSQNELCTSAGVDNKYPTWSFPDGTRHEGGLRPKALAEMSGCVIAE